MIISQTRLALAIALSLPIAINMKEEIYPRVPIIIH